MSTKCTQLSSESATNVCYKGWCYADYNCASSCCEKIPILASPNAWHLCTTDMTNCQNNFPTISGCGYDDCDNIKEGNKCDSWSCN